MEELEKDTVGNEKGVKKKEHWGGTKTNSQRNKKRGGNCPSEGFQQSTIADGGASPGGEKLKSKQKKTGGDEILGRKGDKTRERRERQKKTREAGEGRGILGGKGKSSKKGKKPGGEKGKKNNKIGI